MAERVLLAIHFKCGSGSESSLFDTITFETNWVGQAGLEVCLHRVHVNFVVGALGARQRWLDGAEVKFHYITRVVRVRDRSIINAVKTLGFKILLNHIDTMLLSSDQVQVLHGLVVNWEEAHSCTVLGGHVSNGGSVSEGEISAARSKELNELSNDTTLAEHIGAGEYKICGSGVCR